MKKSYFRFLFLTVFLFFIGSCAESIFGASDSAIAAAEQRIEKLETELAAMNDDDPSKKAIEDEIEKTKAEQEAMIKSREAADENAKAAGGMLNTLLPGAGIALGAIYSLIQRGRKIKADAEKVKEQIEKKKYLDAAKSMITSYDETKSELKALAKENPAFNSMIDRIKNITRKNHTAYGCENDIETLLVEMKSPNIKG